MMKRFFSLLVAVGAFTAASLAQNSLVVTLTHSGKITTYYGASAFSEAYTAAAEGDVITLSAGEFTAVDLEKAVTIRGAGMQMTGEQPTVLSGAFTMNLPSGTNKTLTLEGVECMHDVNVYGTNNMEAATILKCYFNGQVTCANSSPTFIHCVFPSALISTRSWNGSDTNNTNVKCISCVVYNARSDGSANNALAKFDMENCYVAGEPYVGALLFSTVKNCIIRSGWGAYGFDHFITNSLCFGEGFDNISKETNIFYTGEWSDIFKTFTGSNFGLENYELTDEAKAQYLGADGTQVGIYGGQYPFDPTPSTAQVKKFDVSTSTTDGKLNVKINVE